MPRNEKSGKHDTPRIDKDLWNLKITGPAYTKYMTTHQAQQAWFAYLRLISKAARPMPRKTD